MQTTIPLAIGCYLNSADGSVRRDFFNGVIDDVRIYNRTLTLSEIETLYQLPHSTLNETPFAAFSSIVDPNTPYNVGLNASASNDIGGNISSYSWQTSDGQTAQGITPSFDFKQAGTYTITLTATDNQGATSQAQKTLTFYANTTVSNVSQPNQYTLTLNTTGTGQNTVEGAGSYPAGTAVSVTAYPDKGMSFTGWGGDCSQYGTRNPLSFTLNANTQCTANFAVVSELAFDCKARYSTDFAGGKLSVPCIDVHNAFDIPQIVSVDFAHPPFSLDFNLQSETLRLHNYQDACVADYQFATGTLSLPCVVVGDQQFAVTLQQQSGSLQFAVTRVQ